MKIKNKLKVKDSSLFFVVDLYFTFPIFPNANPSPKIKVLHLVYKFSIDIQYTHKCISNQMLKLELQFYITYNSST